MARNPGGLGWHPTGKNYSSEPIHVTDMQSSAWGTRFVTTIINVADLIHTKQFLWAVLTIIKFSVETTVRFFFVTDISPLFLSSYIHLL